MFGAAGESNKHSQSVPSSLTHFQTLKPTCVELLSLGARPAYDKEQRDQLTACLRRLRDSLRSILEAASRNQKQDTPLSSPLQPVLPPSLVHYVFFPVSQLISTSPKGLASLPDSVTEAVFQTLGLLAEQWWYVWNSQSKAGEKDFAVWKDLLILGASVLGDPGKTSTSIAASASDETRAAACHFLHQLLKPRWLQKTSAFSSSPTEWEWDGISDLPALSDLELTEGDVQDTEGAELAFPVVRHLDYAMEDRTSKGALTFCLSASLTLANDSDRSSYLRGSALNLARQSLLLWFGGVYRDQPSAGNGLRTSTLLLHARPAEATATLKAAERLRPLLPGIASTLTRLATANVKRSFPSSSKPNKPTPGIVASKAIDLLRDLLLATLSDESLETILNPFRAGVQDVTELDHSPSLHNEKLEDLASAVDSDGKLVSPYVSDEASTGSTPDSAAQSTEKWALSSLAQTKLALRTLTSLSTSFVTGTTLPSSLSTDIQMSLIDLATVLIIECETAFRWLEQRLQPLPKLDQATSLLDADEGTTVHMLFLWLLDLSAQINTSAVSSHARLALNSLTLQRQIRASTSPAPALVLQSIISNALQKIPAAVREQDDYTVTQLSIRLSTIFELLDGSSTHKGKVQASAASGTTVTSTHWVRHLSRVIKIERLTFKSSSDDNHDWTLEGQFEGLQASTIKQLTRMLQDFGRHAAVSSRIERGQSGEKPRIDDALLDLIAFVVEEAATLRTVRIDANCAESQQQSLALFFIASVMLRGASSVLDNIELSFPSRAGHPNKRTRKSAHKLARKVFASVMDCFDGDTSELLTSTGAESADQQSPSRLKTADQTLLRSTEDIGQDENHLVERVKGLSIVSDVGPVQNNVGPALDLSYVAAASASTRGKLSPQRLSSSQQYSRTRQYTEFANSFLYMLMGSCSRVLGHSFRPLMLQAFYPLISGMSMSSSPLLDDVMRNAASASFRQIAYNSAYANVRNCMMDQADYVIGGACQRLICGLDEELYAFTTVSAPSLSASSTADGQLSSRALSQVLLPVTSAQRAPYVLVEMVRMLGSEVLPMIQDAIDEILDALDRFHENHYVADGLLTVLGSILETMASEQATTSSVMNSNVKAVNNVSQAELVGDQETDERAQLQVWLTERTRRKAGFDVDATSGPDEEDLTPPTEEKKTPNMTTQILLKAVPFLTHSSPALRCRVLDLLRHGIETLAPQKLLEDLLPVVNNAWPFVMSRLGQPYSSTHNDSSSLPLIIDLNASTFHQKASMPMTANTRTWAEQQPQVWIAASRFVAVAAQHISEFTARKIVQDAWPRFAALLQCLEHNHGSNVNSILSNENIAPVASTRTVELQGALPRLISEVGVTRPHKKTAERSPGPYVVASPTSLPAELIISIASSLTATITYAGTSMSDDVAWEITNNPILLGLLDDRQPFNVQEAAVLLYTSLAKRNADATSFVLHGTFSSRGEVPTTSSSMYPRFLRCSDVRGDTKVLRRILSS